MHRHRWTQWGVPHEGYGYDAVQVRTCQRCAKLDVRKLGWTKISPPLVDEWAQAQRVPNSPETAKRAELTRNA